MLVYLSKIALWCRYYQHYFGVRFLLASVPHSYFESLVLAHGLKSPLSTLSLALHEAKSSAHSPVKLRAALQQADTSRLKLQALLFADRSPRNATFNVVEQLGLVVSWFRACGHNVQVLLKHDHLEEVQASGSTMLFQQLLEILIDNGLKASVQQGIIIIAVSRETDELQIIVHDFGAGFSNETPQADRWGVGLNCARHIIRLFRGRLKILTRHEVGTQVICRMPLSPG